jgi:hypothetical protein
LAETKARKLDEHSAVRNFRTVAGVTIAKNYPDEREMPSLERIVTAYPEFAEFQATRQILQEDAENDA